MQIPGSTAIALVACTVLAGCAGGSRDASTPSERTGPTAPSSTAAIPSTSTGAPGPSIPAAPPASGADLAEVIRWIEAGAHADPAGFRSVTLDGKTTPLTDGVAFVTPGTTANCVTNRYADNALACLVKLTNPPARPTDFPSGWKDNWVDYDGTSVQIGSPHGDPGPFVTGTGAMLAAGRSLTFGDYRCRSDATDLFCVDYAHQSAVRMSAAGIEPFGCLKETTPPPDIGVRFTC